jgi:hypothetical protein
LNVKDSNQEAKTQQSQAQKPEETQQQLQVNNEEEKTSKGEF